MKTGGQDPLRFLYQEQSTEPLNPDKNIEEGNMYDLFFECHQFKQEPKTSV